MIRLQEALVTLTFACKFTQVWFGKNTPFSSSGPHQFWHMPSSQTDGGYLLAVVGHLSVPGGREDFSQHGRPSCPAAMNVWLSFVIKKFMIRAIPREAREDTLQNEHPKVPVQSWLQLWQHCARFAFCPRGGFCSSEGTQMIPEVECQCVGVCQRQKMAPSSRREFAI